MNIEQLLKALSSKEERNETLAMLEEVFVDVDDRFAQVLCDIIRNPDSIENTNRFASLLEEINGAATIPVLIEMISSTTPGENYWLCDYMYALRQILSTGEQPYPAEEEFVHLLGKWLSTTGGGEIACHAAAILAELGHPAVRDYLLKGAEDQSLVHLERMDCITGIVYNHCEVAQALLDKLSNDPEPEVREHVARGKKWLAQQDPNR